MDRLNIPFSSGRRARTRRSRRVFAIALLLGAFFLGVWRVSEAVATRDTVFAAQPAGARASVRFTPNAADWDLLERWFGATPVITDRPLTVSDLRGLARGEFAVFFEEDGHTSVALRTESRLLPQDELDALGIVVQSISKDVYLLSDRLLAVQGVTELPKNGFFQRFFGFGGHDGDLRFIGEDGTPGAPLPIVLGEEGLYVRLRGEKTGAFPWKTLPPHTRAAMSTPVLTEEEVEPLTARVDHGWGTDTAVLLETLALSTETAPKYVWIGQKEGISTVLLGGNAAVSEETLGNFLKTWVAAAEPSVRVFSLPDGSSVKEIYADPSRISLEVMTRNGLPVFRATTPGGAYYAVRRPDGFALTNDEAALALWLGEATGEEGTRCGAFSFFADLGAASDARRRQLPFSTPSFTYTLFETLPFLHIGSGNHPWLTLSTESCG